MNQIVTGSPAGGLNSFGGLVDIKKRPGEFAPGRSNTAGLGVAHDIGLTHGPAGVVAMTNDDFEADNSWMHETTAVFAQNSRVAVVYCSVVRLLDDPRPVLPTGSASSRLA